MLYVKQSRTTCDCMSGDEVLYARNGWMQEKNGWKPQLYVRYTKTAKSHLLKGKGGD